MKALNVGMFLVLFGVASGVSPAQNSGRTYGSPSGFGNIIFPGMGTPPPVESGHAFRPGRPVGGGYPGGGGNYRGGGRNNTVVVPYGIPVYMGGGGYGNGYDAPPPQQQQAPPAPPVIINQYFSPEIVRPVMREYNDLPEPTRREPERDENPNVKVYPPAARVTPPPPPFRSADEPKANVTLIALKDSTVIAAIGYWAENGDLIYITKTYARKTLPLDRIDKDLTDQLNRERGVEFLLTEK
jgi:hypothetical protein